MTKKNFNEKTTSLVLISKVSSIAQRDVRKKIYNVSKQYFKSPAPTPDVV